MERTIKLLPVDLTREQMDEYAQRIAMLSGEIADAERKIESEKEIAKAKVKEAESIAEGLSARQRQLSRVVIAKREEREVSCTVRFDRYKRERILTREDTGEEVERRPLTDAEVTAGATWHPDLERGVAELRHPDEPDLVLGVRELTDEERQVELPGVAAQKKGKRKPVSEEEMPL